MTTKEQATLNVMIAVAEAIRDLGKVPSGHLYARLMNYMSLSSYQSIIAALKRAGLVEEKNFLLRWVGPTFSKVKEKES